MFKVKTKLTKEPLAIYLVADPHIKSANSEESLVKYMHSRDKNDIVIPEGAAEVLMKPLTPGDLDKVRDRMPLQNHLGSHIASKKERDLDIKEAKQVFESVLANKESSERQRIEALDAYSEAEAKFLHSLSPQELGALKDHAKWIEQFGQELMLESLVQFPFRDEDDNLYVPKGREETLMLLRSVSPKRLSDEIIQELIGVAYKLSYLSAEGKA
jgi:hypothetical protein